VRGRVCTVGFAQTAGGANLLVAVNIFFDCDYTILSFDQVLRSRTKEVFGRLVDDGHQVYLWSGEGARWSVVRRHELEPYLSGVFGKPLHDFDAGLKRLQVSTMPDFVIDDYPGIVRHFGGYHIPEFYSSRSDDDEELESVYQVVREVASTGRTDHPRWWPGTASRPDLVPDSDGSG
jgi:hypothetical protein